MTTSIARMEACSPQVAGSRPERDAIGPAVGQNVPEDPVARAMRGILWSVTLARVVLVPVFLVGALRAQELALGGEDFGRLRWGLLLTLAVIVGSDVLDGWIARRFGLATQEGAIADALADKLAQVAFVAFFTFSGGPAFASLPLWFFALILGRDLVLGGGWLSLRRRGAPVRVVHRFHGRAATVGVFAMLSWLTAGLEGTGLTALTLLTAALIWVSTGAYVADAWMALRGVASSTTDGGHGGAT